MRRPEQPGGISSSVSLGPVPWFLTPPDYFSLNSGTVYTTSLLSELCVSNWPITSLFSATRVNLTFPFILK